MKTEARQTEMRPFAGKKRKPPYEVSGVFADELATALPPAAQTEDDLI